MYSIVLAPNEILRTATKPIDPAMAGLQKIIEEMKHILVTQYDPEGVGLAANQVGLPYRLFLARFTTKKNSPIFTFINPEIIEHSKELQAEDKKAPLEGCLSLPKYYGVVKRYQWVKMKYIDDSGVARNDVFKGFAATVIQHEMDHLNGKIFVERILEQEGKLYKLSLRPSATKITGKKKMEEVWEEVEI